MDLGHRVAAAGRADRLHRGGDPAGVFRRRNRAARQERRAAHDRSRTATCAARAPRWRFPAMSMRAAGSPRNCSSRGQFDAADRSLSGRPEGHFRARSDACCWGWRGRNSPSSEFAAARAALERLTQHNPDFKSADAQLLYARTLEALERARRGGARLCGGGAGISRRRGAAALWLAAQAARQGQEARRVLKDLLDGGEARVPRITAGRRPSGWIARGGS